MHFHMRFSLSQNRSVQIFVDVHHLPALQQVHESFPICRSWTLFVWQLFTGNMMCFQFVWSKQKKKNSTLSISSNGPANWENIQRKRLKRQQQRMYVKGQNSATYTAWLTGDFLESAAQEYNNTAVSQEGCDKCLQWIDYYFFSTFHQSCFVSCAYEMPFSWFESCFLKLSEKSFKKNGN